MKMKKTLVLAMAMALGASRSDNSDCSRLFRRAEGKRFRYGQGA